MRPVIVGGGIIGNYLASQLQATVIERKQELGKPVACTGLLTTAIENYLPSMQLRKLAQNTLTQTRVHSPKAAIDISLSKNYVLDKAGLVKYFAKKAEENGSTILTNHQFLGNDGKRVHVKDLKTGKRKVIATKLLIGADGPVSNVAKYNNLFNHRQHLSGVQTLTRHDMDERIDFHPHIGEYAWAVPEGKKKVRLGIAARSNAKHVYDSFSEQYRGAFLEHQSGVIPLFHPKTPYVKPFVALVGDAAAQNKNTTGGGIITGFRAADALTKAITEGKLSDYTKNLKPLRRELYAHYYANKAFQNFSGKDWDKLIAQTSSVKHLLRDEHRDSFTSLAIKLLLRKPTYAFWARKLLS